MTQISTDSALVAGVLWGQETVGGWRPLSCSEGKLREEIGANASRVTGPRYSPLGLCLY